MYFFYGLYGLFGLQHHCKLVRNMYVALVPVDNTFATLLVKLMLYSVAVYLSRIDPFVDRRNPIRFGAGFLLLKGDAVRFEIWDMRIDCLGWSYD